MSITSGSYFCAEISVRPFVSADLASYFRGDYKTLHPSIPLASYFCAVHPLGELFSCLPFNYPSFGELLSCRPCNSPSAHPSGELFLCCLSLGWFIFVTTINSPSFGELLSCRPCNSPSVHPFGELFSF